MDKRDITALRAFHVRPLASIVVVLRNGSAVYFKSMGDVVRGVPDYWQPGMKVYTASFVLGDGSWWRWIGNLYGGYREIVRHEKTLEEE